MELANYVSGRLSPFDFSVILKVLNCSKLFSNIQNFRILQILLFNSTVFPFSLYFTNAQEYFGRGW